MIKLRTHIEEHAKEIENLVNLTNQTIEKISDAKSELSFKYDDIFENLSFQIKKQSISINTLTDKIEKASETHQNTLEEINRSFSSRLEALSKTLINENRSLNERIYKNEKDLDLFNREIKSNLNNLERGLLIQDEKLKLSLNHQFH